MTELLEKLEVLFATEGYDYEDDGYQYFVEDDLYNEVTSLCCEELITNSGGCNWTNIRIVREHGYRVFPGDKDSFGWLVGCIGKPDDKRIVCYG